MEEWQKIPCKNSWRALNKEGYHKLYKPKYGYHTEHRYVYAKHHKLILDESDKVLHHCDNRACIEIAHLFLGTDADNSRDKLSKNRQSRGESAGPVKLTEKQVLEIRRRYKMYNITQKELADEYGLKSNTVSAIIKRKLWKHI